MSFLFKKINADGKEVDYYPKRVSSLSELEKLFKYCKFDLRFKIRVEPENNPEIEKLLEDEDSYPDMEAVVDAYMENWSGACTCKGSPAIMYYSNGDPGDPGSPPEFDLPDEDTFRDDVKEDWANEWLKDHGFKFEISSMEISADDRYMILEAADDFYTDTVGRWPDSYEIEEKYAEVDEPDYEYDPPETW